MRHEGSRILTNAQGTLQIEVLDPNEELVYMDRRFSSTAYVLQARYQGQDFLYTAMNAGTVHPALGGIPCEFDIGTRTNPPGFAEAALGEYFLKIGVGILEKDNQTYHFFREYPFHEKATTQVEWHDHGALFTQTLTKSAQGFSYAMTVHLELLEHALKLTCRLKNTGTRSFQTEQYLHNFLSFSGHPLTADYTLKFPYAPPSIEIINAPEPPPFDLFVLNGSTVGFNLSGKVPKGMGHCRVLPPAHDSSPNEVIVHHARTGQKLTLRASLPSHAFVIWTDYNQLSAEDFIRLDLDPAEEISFSRFYLFETHSLPV